MFTLLPKLGRLRAPLLERREAAPVARETVRGRQPLVRHGHLYHGHHTATEPKPEAPREVVGQAEIQLEDRITVARTLYVSDRMLEVYSKSRLPVRAQIQARLMGETEDWSHGVVSKCVETIGGWKVEMLFDSTAPGGSC